MAPDTPSYEPTTDSGPGYSGPGYSGPSYGGGAPQPIVVSNDIIAKVMQAGSQHDASTPEGQSMVNMAKIAAAMLAYHELHGYFPPAILGTADGRAGVSWRVELLPYFGYQDLYNKYQRNEPWDSPTNRQVASNMPAVYGTPGVSPGQTSYLVAVGPDTLFPGGQVLSSNQISDGPVATLMVVEADAEQAVAWTRPQDLVFAPNKPVSGLGKLRGGKFLAAFADGSVHAVSAALDPDVVRALFSPAGQEAMPPAALAKHLATPPGPPMPEPLLPVAKRLLAEGRGKEAHACLLADAVVRGDKDGEVLATLRWSEGLRRPVLMTRVGLAIDAPLAQLIEAAMQPNRSNYGSGQGGGGDAGDNVTKVIGIWLAAIGQPVVSALESRVDQGKLGVWLKADADHKSLEQRLQMALNGTQRTGPGGQSGMMGSDMASPSSDMMGSEMMGSGMGPSPAGPPGMVSPGALPQGGQPPMGQPGGMSPDGMGSPPEGMGSPSNGMGSPSAAVPPRLELHREVVLAQQAPMEGGMGGEMGGANAFEGFAGLLANLQALTKQLHAVHPGIVVLGVSTEEKVYDLARKQDIDVVLFVRIKVGPPKVGRAANAPPQSTFQLKLLDVSRPGEFIYVCRPLDNVKVTTAMASAHLDDPIKAIVDNATQAIDTKLVLGEMPAMTPELAQKRAEYLAKGSSENPLPGLMELRYYQSKGLLTTEQVTAAYKQIVGDDGVKLATGSPRERRNVVDRWLPEIED